MSLKDDTSLLIEKSLKNFYLDSLLGFALTNKKYEVIKTNKNTFLVLKPFIFPLEPFEVSEVEELFNQLENKFFVLPKNFSQIDLFENKGYKIQKRVNFSSHNENAISQIKLINGIQIIDESLFNRIRKLDHFQNHLRNYESFKEFSEYGCGSCHIQNDKIVSIASSFCHFEKKIEIQVDTLSNHRGKGLAFQTCVHLINNAYSKGFAPRWDAATSISKSLGEKLGFFGEKEYFMVHKHKID